MSISDHRAAFARKPTSMLSKRIFDIALCFVFSPVLVPLSLIVAISVRIWLGSPVLYVQKRAGYKGDIFLIRKFRTMSDARDQEGHLLADELRLGPFGTFLRSSSLDELPAIINVIEGTMSLVGPRPLLEEYLPLYNKQQSRRHDILPGVTGWAQIHGRNSINWERKFELDLWYVDNHNLRLDILILLRTIFQVLRRKGITSEGQAAGMKPFTGSDDSSCQTKKSDFGENPHTDNSEKS